jgi:adenylate kinase
MITAKYRIPSASPGAMLREEKCAGSALGVEAEKLTSQGRLVPDEMVCSVVRSWLAKHDGEFVFDGFPRSRGQADALDEMLAARNTPLDVVLSLDAGFDTIASRVQNRLVCSVCRTNVSIGLHVAGVAASCPECGGALIRRGDDNLETLQIRMREYAEKTEPLISHYAEHGLLRSIDATRVPAEVFSSIAAILEAE